MTAVPPHWLTCPLPRWDETTLSLFDHLYQQHVFSGKAEWISQDLHVPAWSFLTWMAQHHPVVFHGSGNPEIQVFEPRTPVDFSADDFSKQRAVFASSDAIWAIFYAVLDRDAPIRFLNGALQFRDEAGWGAMRYFFSINQQAFERKPWKEGTLYILPRAPLRQQPSYTLQEWDVLEPHWACTDEVKPLAKIRVGPQDFPFLNAVRSHDQRLVDFWASQDPEGFPWLDEDETPKLRPADVRNES